jgi:hypothetical protein
VKETVMRHVPALIPLLALLVAACGASATVSPTTVSPATGPVGSALPAPSATAPATATVPSETSPGESTAATQAGPTPGGADVTGIDACTLITQAEAEAALGVATKPPFGGGVPDVNIRSCMYQSTDGNGPQVGMAVSGAPDGFRPDLVAVTAGPPYSSEPTAVPDLGDEAWFWLDPRGFRLEARDGDRYIAFEFNDFRTSDKPTDAALGVLVPLMETALSRLP